VNGLTLGKKCHLIGALSLAGFAAWTIDGAALMAMLSVLVTNLIPSPWPVPVLLWIIFQHTKLKKSVY